MNEAGHVIPAAEIQAEDVIAKVPGEFFHLKREGMGFDERHALDGVCGQAFCAGDHLKQVAPPEGFVAGLGFGDVEAERVRERRDLDLIGDHGDVEQRGGEQLAGKDAGLMEMQAAGAREDDGFAGLDGDAAVALAIEIAEASGESLQDVVNAAGEMLPSVGVGVLEIEHHAGRAGVQHLDDEVGVVGGAGHLIALVGAPFGQLDSPGVHGGDRLRQVAWELAGVRFDQRGFAASDQIALAGRERGVQRREKFEEAGGEVAGGVKARRRGVDGSEAVGEGGLRGG